MCNLKFIKHSNLLRFSFRSECHCNGMCDSKWKEKKIYDWKEKIKQKQTKHKKITLKSSRSWRHFVTVPRYTSLLVRVRLFLFAIPVFINSAAPWESEKFGVVSKFPVISFSLDSAECQMKCIIINRERNVKARIAKPKSSIFSSFHCNQTIHRPAWVRECFYCHIEMLQRKKIGVIILLITISLCTASDAQYVFFLLCYASFALQFTPLRWNSLAATVVVTLLFNWIELWQCQWP